MRRLISLVLAGALAAMVAGTATAAPNRSATLWGCLRETSGVQLTVDWAGYHPDTLWTVAWTSGDSTVWTYPTPRSVDWKYGTSTYSTSYGTWSSAAASLAFTADTYLAVRLYHRTRFLAETNALRYGDLVPCG